MKDFVHYLIRQIGGEDGLITPRQLNRLPHFTLGCFYILGIRRRPLLEAYRFHAMRDGEIVLVPLVRYRESRSFYRAPVDGVGSFIFHLQPIPNELPYAGNVPGLEGLQAIRRLRARKPADLEEACRKYNFYFLGYSEAIDEPG